MRKIEQNPGSRFGFFNFLISLTFCETVVSQGRLCFWSRSELEKVKKKEMMSDRFAFESGRLVAADAGAVDVAEPRVRQERGQGRVVRRQGQVGPRRQGQGARQEAPHAHHQPARLAAHVAQSVDFFFFSLFFHRPITSRGSFIVCSPLFDSYSILTLTWSLVAPSVLGFDAAT